MGKVSYPKAALWTFRGDISAINATLRGVARELETIAAPQAVVEEVEGLAAEGKALFERADNANRQSYEEDVYQHLYISSAFKLHLIMQYTASIIAPHIALLTLAEQASLKKVTLLAVMQEIISQRLQSILTELNADET